MTHPNPAHRKIVTNFVDNSGRFTRFLRPSLEVEPISDPLVKATPSMISVPLNTPLAIKIVAECLPGDFVTTHTANPMRIYNRSSVTTIAYNTISDCLVYAAVTWHPDSVRSKNTRYNRDPFRRQPNLVHTVLRYNSLPISIPLTDPTIQEAIDNKVLTLGQKNQVIWMDTVFADWLVRTHGHEASV